MCSNGTVIFFFRLQKIILFFQLPKWTQVNFQYPFSLPKDENASQLQELALYRYTYESFEEDDFKTKYYTGLRTFKILNSLCKVLGYIYSVIQMPS